MAGLQPEALFEAVAQQAASDQGTESLVDEEPQVRDEMANMRLEIPYVRPRSRRVARAVSAVVVMLIDRGWLTKEHLEGLDILLRRADPWFLAHRPSPRPAIVRPIRERANSEYAPKGWTEALALDDAVTGALDGEGWMVIAEETWQRWLDWKLPVETRVGALFQTPVELVREVQVSAEQEEADAESRSASALTESTADVGQRLVSEYAEMETNERMIIVRSRTFRLDTPNAFWLAIHPDLAHHLKWQLAAEGLFRWTDISDRVMAESIWWQDGFGDLRPPEFHDEVAHGWLVRVSPEGWRQIQSVLSAAATFRRVERSSSAEPPRAVAGLTPVR